VIEIGHGVSIDDDELNFTWSRSSGPGGQHVNKVETRATLWFDVAGSPSLSEAQRERVMQKLPTRITREGRLRVVSQRHRSRRANREAAVGRFVELMREALARPRPRTKTRVPKSVKRRRLEQKRRRSEIKRSRSRPRGGDD